MQDKEENKRLYMRLANEVLNGKDLSVVDQLIDANFVEPTVDAAQSGGKRPEIPNRGRALRAGRKSARQPSAGTGLSTGSPTPET